MINGLALSRTVSSHPAKRRFSVVAYAATLIFLLLEVGSPAVSGAAFTTTANGSRVNANLYANKCDVYINGGPNNGVSALTDGEYFFAVLAPGGQKNPNDGTAKNLSDDVDAISNRTFTVSGNHIVSTGGSHRIIDDPSTTLTTDKLIQLCDYADTPNPGGVYILAICSTANLPVDPRDCKYDAFKVKKSGGKRVSDLVAFKTATPAFDRANTWQIQKDINSTTIDASAGSVTIGYEVGVTKTVTDSNYRVTGDITVFNPNDKPASAIVVTDAMTGGVCVVTNPIGFTGTIAASSHETFAYTCTFSGAQSDSATNTATITWDKASLGSPGSTTTAVVGFTWPTAPTAVSGPATVTVTDTLGGSTVTLGTASSTTSFTHTKVIAVTWTGCRTITNIATIVETGQSDSASTEVCTNDGAHTMGFWRNKNGQATIASANPAALCAYLADFENVLGDIDSSTCNTPYLQTYVTNVIDLAEASGTGEAMYKAQFLATALSSFFDTALAGTSIVVDGSLLGTTNCITVAQLLTSADAHFTNLLADKPDLMAVKDYLDRVNNNIAITC